MIDTPAPLAGDVLSDVRLWPNWTGSVERIVPMGGTAVEVGNRVGVVTQGLSRRYLSLEAAGLKDRSERNHATRPRATSRGEA